MTRVLDDRAPRVGQQIANRAGQTAQSRRRQVEGHHAIRRAVPTNASAAAADITNGQRGRYPLLGIRCGHVIDQLLERQGPGLPGIRRQCRDGVDEFRHRSVVYVGGGGGGSGGGHAAAAIVAEPKRTITSTTAGMADGSGRRRWTSETGRAR